MNNHKGFTLIEIVIALAILAITMTTLLLSSSQVSQNTRYLRDKTFASIIASNIINKTRFGLNTATSGKQKQAGKEYEWGMQVQNTSDPFTRKLIVTVRLEGYHNPLMVMTGYQPVLTP